MRPTNPNEPGPLDNAANRPLHDLTVEFALRGALMATYYSHSAEAASGGMGGAGVEAVWGKPSRTFLRCVGCAVLVGGGREGGKEGGRMGAWVTRLYMYVAVCVCEYNSYK